MLENNNNIFTSTADMFERLDKQIFEFLKDISPNVAEFEKLEVEQQQELITTIAEKGYTFCDQVLSVSWGQDSEKAIFELQNANKTDLTNDLKVRFEELHKVLKAFFCGDNDIILKKIKDFTIMNFTLDAGLYLKETIRQLRRIAAQTAKDSGTNLMASSNEYRVGKSSKISNFFWKLYEETLKVIVDAILKKSYPN